MVSTKDRFLPFASLFSVVLLLSLSACEQLAKDGTAPPYSHRRLPPIGALVNPQPALVRCDTENQALAMSSSGLFVPGCERLIEINTFRVLDHKRRELPEGSVWLVTVANADGKVAILPFPWHNWV
ncbi:MAG: hypothetical protein KTR35_12300 [Gammaproteobacteria bacterium]|nr:hypothetical protein [Gammaproteobacteria bacterium]